MNQGVVTTAFIFCVALVGCETDPGPSPFFPLDAPAVWSEVRTCRNSIEHPGMNVRVFAEGATKQAYLGKVYPFALGATLVKAEYADSHCAEFVQFTAMRKVSIAAAAAGGGWAWQTVKGGQVVPNATACIGCHVSSCADKDSTCVEF